MVFGNLGQTSGTGVAFSRCPSNGKPELMGEYLINAQGEDVVAGAAPIFEARPLDHDVDKGVLVAPDEKGMEADTSSGALGNAGKAPEKKETMK